MGIFFSFISNLEYIGLLILIVLLISDATFKMQKRNWIIAIILLAGYTCITSIVQNANIQLLAFIISISLVFETLILGARKRLICDAVIAIVLISISTQILKTSTIVFASMLHWKIGNGEARSVAQLVLLLLVGSIYFYIRYKHPTELKNIPLKYIVIFTVVLLADCISITFLGEYILTELELERTWFAELAYVLMGLGVFVQLGLLIALYFSRNAYRTQQALATKYLEEQVAHYQYLSEREQNTKRFCHDFKSHMAMAKQLYEEGKREEFEAYFHKMTEQIAAIGNRVTVNNDIADAIINRYYDEAALAGITMEVEGHFPGECYVSAYDLCTVLSNLLSNAIDAEKEAGGKTIYCGVRYDETQILIVVKNDYVNPIKRTDNRFVSTKGDLRHQGFGIANINEVVRKNNGHIFYDTADARFVVRLSLCNMKQNS